MALGFSCLIMNLMVLIPRRVTPGEEFPCSHCGTLYEVSTSPGQDTGSATCDVCGEIMLQWNDTAIPLFRVKSRADDQQPL